MNFIDVIIHRYSVRRYKNMPVEQEKVVAILEAGRIAPSAVNFQPWYFIVVTEGENRKSLNQVYPRPWFETAPIVVIICADQSKSWKRRADNHDYAFVDAAIAIDHMTLQAVDLGLGTCWVCNFDVDLCRKILEIPDHINPVALLPVGYPDDLTGEKNRKDLSEIVFWEKFGKT
jgi:nitroreductase